MPESVSKPQTLYDKVLSKHIIDEKLDGTLLLYIGTSAIGRPLHSWLAAPKLTSPTPPDRHLVHEVTSPVRHSLVAGFIASAGID